MPYGFKGAYVSQLWQVAVRLESPTGNSAVGLGTQSVLWADSSVFAAHPEEQGNRLMYSLAVFALSLVENRTFAGPPELLAAILNPAWEYGRRITGNPGLRPAFVLNALVPLDNAAWLLSARENGIASFDRMIPARFAPALKFRHSRVAAVPVVSYNTPTEEITGLAAEGFFILKLKIGNPGAPREMLAKDLRQFELVHRLVGDHRTPHTNDGRLCYYIDANGRYPDRETLLEFLGRVEKIGALDRILLLEEPFSSREISVRDLGVLVAADELVERPEDVGLAGQLGYRALALKPAAKTFTLTLEMALAAHTAGLHCFCADLTVNPVLAEWNRNVAARLAPLPGLDMGLMESNGAQLYRDWPRLESYHPLGSASWRRPAEGVFRLEDSFYERNGGLFDVSSHYRGLFDLTD